MKLILIIASVIAVSTAQRRQTSFGRTFSLRDDSPEDRFDDSRERSFRSGNRFRHDSRSDSREGRFSFNTRIGNNRFDDSRSDSREGRFSFNTRIGNNRFDDSRSDSREGRFSFNTRIGSNRLDDSRENFGIGGFRSSIGSQNLGGRRRQHSDEDSFEIRNRNTFRTSFGNSGRRRFDDTDETFENRGGQFFRKIDDSPERFGFNRNSFRSRTTNNRFGTSISSFNRFNNSPRRPGGHRNSFGRFDDSPEISTIGRTTFNRFDDSPEISTIGRTTFNRFDDSPEISTIGGTTFVQLDDSDENVFRRRNLFNQPRRITPTGGFGVGRTGVTQRVNPPKRPLSFTRNLVSFGDSDETFEVNRNTFGGRSNIQRFKPSLNRFDDSPEDHFGRNVNTFKSGISNNFIDDDSDEDVFINLFNKPRVSPQPQRGRVHDHFSNRNIFNTGTFGRTLPRTDNIGTTKTAGVSLPGSRNFGTTKTAGVSLPGSRNFGTTQTAGVSLPGSFHFDTPVGQRKPAFPQKKKSQPPKKTPAPFRFNTQFGKPLKRTRPTTFPKTGRTDQNKLKRIPFSTVKTPGITGFKWPGENVSGYYVSMSTNNRPATSYFVRLD